jgi:disulfide bond formation protein DsbB
MTALYPQKRLNRRVNGLVTLVCFALVAVAVALEHWAGMEPCPLCWFQRMAFVALGGVAAIGMIAPGRLVAGLGVLAAASGVALAWRHLWLQSLPPSEVPACGPGLDYMLDTFPLADAVAMILSGSGECAEVDRVLGVSIPAWTLLAFLILGTVMVLGNRRARGSARS